MPASAPGFSEPNQTAFAVAEASFEYVALGKAGRFVIPIAMREALGLSEGDRIMVSLHNNVVTLESQKSVLRRLQDECRALALPGASVVDELIADRRREGKQEAEPDARKAAGNKPRTK